jgi:tRNA G18 (ribose-2'-O)-methylase SpoU
MSENDTNNLIYGRNAVIELLKAGHSIDKIYVKAGEREGSLNLFLPKQSGWVFPWLKQEKVSLMNWPTVRSIRVSSLPLPKKIVSI